MSNIPSERAGLVAEARERMLQGGTRCVILGQAGVGKSTILDAVVEALRASTDTFVMHTRSFKDGDPPRYHGLRDMFASVDIASFDLSAEQRGALALALGYAQDREIAVDAVHAAVHHVLQMMSRDRRVIVAIDDVEYLDDDTHHLLGYVANRPDNGARSTSFIATITSDPALTGGPPAFDLAACSVDDLFLLPPLSRAAFRDLVTAAVRYDLAGTDLDDLFARTGGNPKWGLELVYQSAPGIPLRNVPLSMRETALERIDSLPSATVRLLAALALLGSSTPAELVAILQITDSELASAQQSGLVLYDGDMLRPVHPILAGAALDQLDPDGTTALRNGIFNGSTSIVERATQLDRVTVAGQDEAVASLLLNAAVQSRDDGEIPTAIRLVRRSIARTDPSAGTFLPREWALAEMLFSQGMVDESAAILEKIPFAMLSIADLDRLLPLTLVVLSARDGEAEAARYLRRLRVALDHDATRCAMLDAYKAEAEGDPDERRRLAGGALAVLREADAAPITRHRAIGALVAANLDSGFGLDSNLLEEAEQLEPRLAELALNDSADGQRALFAYQADDLDTSRRALEIIGRRAKDEGEVFMAAVFGIHLAAVQALSGQLDTARATIAEWESFEAFTSPPPSLVTARGLILLRDTDEAPLRDLVAQPHRHGSESIAVIVRAALIGMAAARRHRWEEAVFELERARDVSLKAGIAEPGRRLWADFALAQTYVALQRTEEAAEIGEGLKKISGGQRPLLDGAASRIDGLIADRQGRSAEATALLRRSVGLLSSAGFPSEMALSLFELGRHLLTTRMRDGAAETLARAAEIASSAGDLQLVEMIGRTQSSTRSGAIHTLLSARERIIAEEAAEGRTNREIAESHFLSIRTVETQLSSAYRKLGIRSRGELTALVIRERAG